MTQPRVTAEHEIDPTEIRTTFTNGRGPTSPHVQVLVEFDHGDHAQALTLLAAALDSVTEQIQATDPEAPPTAADLDSLARTFHETMSADVAPAFHIDWDDQPEEFRHKVAASLAATLRLLPAAEQ